MFNEQNDFSLRVRAMFQDLMQNFHIGTRAGLYLYDKEKTHFLVLRHSELPYSILGFNSILKGTSKTHSPQKFLKGISF